MKKYILSYLVLIFTLKVNPGKPYKSVILMHGIKDGPEVFNDFLTFVEKVHPGTNVTALPVDSGWYSIFTPMWKQVHDVIQAVSPVMRENPAGVHLIGYSQGGLVCRGVLQSMADHNVENFISLSSPQAGQYGDTSAFRYFFPRLVKSEMYRFFYTTEGQRNAVGNYWNAYNESEDVIEMRRQQWYIDDWFGLKTLDGRGALHVYEEPDIEHHHWVKNFTIFQKYIQPWLT